MYAEMQTTGNKQRESVSPWILDPIGKLKVASPEHTRKFQSVDKEVIRIANEISLLDLQPLVPKVMYQEPKINEDEIKYVVSEGDKQIAALKGYDPEEASLYRKKRESLSPSMSTLEFLKVHAEKLHLSYANDIVTTVVIDGEKVLEHKIDPGSSKADVLAHLSTTVGQKSPDDPFVEVGWRETLALHEAATDISVVRQNTHELLLYRPSLSFLHALVYGLHDADHPVDTQTSKQFLRLYENGTEYSRPDHAEKPDRHSNNWAGWTPETGMPLENLLRVNGARPGDTLPFVELLVAQVDGLRPTQTGFDVKVSAAIKDVRGKARDLRYILRVLLETIASNKTVGDIAKFQGDASFQELAVQLEALQANGELDNSWVYSGRTKEISGEKNSGNPTLIEELALALLGLHTTDVFQ